MAMIITTAKIVLWVSSRTRWKLLQALCTAQATRRLAAKPYRPAEPLFGEIVPWEPGQPKTVRQRRAK